MEELELADGFRLPIISLQALESADFGKAMKHDLEAIDIALQTSGCFFVRDLGHDMMRYESELRQCSIDFFRCSIEEKNERSEHPEPAIFKYKGWKDESSGFFRNAWKTELQDAGLDKQEIHSNYLQGDRKESFQMGPVGTRHLPEFSANEPLGPLFERTAWPSSKLNPDFREKMELYYESSVEVGVRVSRVLEMAVEANDGELSSEFLQKLPHLSTLKLNFYPSSCHSSSEDEKLAMAEHIDAGFCTLIAGDPQDTGLSGYSLEVWDGNRWQGIPSVQGALLFQLGFMGKLKSNGRWKPCWHRVVSPVVKDKENVKSRCSIVTFIIPPANARLEPPSCFLRASQEVLEESQVSVLECLTEGRMGKVLKDFSNSKA